MELSGFESALNCARQCNENRGRDYDRGLAPECYPDGPDDPLYGTGLFYKSYEEEEDDDD